MGEKAISTGLNLLFYFILFYFILELELFLMFGTRSLSLLIFIFYKKAFISLFNLKRKILLLASLFRTVKIDTCFFLDKTKTFAQWDLNL